MPSRDDWTLPRAVLLDRVRQGANDRRTWLALASATQREKGKAAAKPVTELANELFPATTYDSAAAFAVLPNQAAQRDAMANFLIEHRAQIVATALRRCNPDVRPRWRRRAGASKAPLRAYMYWNTSDRPAIVRRCFEAARAYLPADLELVEIDDDRLHELVPAAMDLGRNLQTAAQRSDLIRAHLMSIYGGLWIDATVLLRKDFPLFLDQLRAQDWFMFRYRGSRVATWLFWGLPTGYRVQLVRAALDLWLEQGRDWSNYFMYHDVIEMLYWTDERYRSEWDAGLLLHPREALVISRKRNVPVSDAEWADLLDRSPLYKLSWKFKPEALESPDTPISRVIAGDLG